MKNMEIKRYPINGDLFATFEKSMNGSRNYFLDYPWEEKKYYAAWVAQMYYFLCQATRLLCYGAAKFPLSYNEWHYRFVDHAAEERRHEDLAKNDLIALGYTINDFPEMHELKSLYQSQFYLMDHVHSASLFGSIIYLEGLSITTGRSVLERVKKTYPEGTYSFLKSHVHDDDRHIVEAMEALEKADSSSVPHIISSLEQVTSIYEIFMKNLVKSVEKNDLLMPRKNTIHSSERPEITN